MNRLPLLLCVLVVTGCANEMVYSLDGEIYKVGCNERPQQLTSRSGPDGADHPRWSPDGRWIAFRAWRSGAHNELQAIDRNGGSRIDLTFPDSIGDAFALDWAPDSDQIVFEMKGGSRGPDRIYKTSISRGSAGLQLMGAAPGFTEFDPDWSPDGRKIVFARRLASSPTETEIATMNADGTNVTRLLAHRFVNGPTEPTWSPDGRFIAFSRVYSDSPAESGTYVVEADGTGLRRVSERPLIDFLPESTYEWSPNGRYLAYPCSPDLCVLRYDPASDTFSTALTLRGERSDSPRRTRKHGTGNFHPRLLDDLSYYELTQAPGALDVQVIRTIDMATGARRDVVEGVSGSWSSPNRLCIRLGSGG